MMKMMLLVSFMLVGAAMAQAKVYEVKMLNKGSDGQPMVFEPAFLKIEKGDSVKFVPTDKSHSAESYKEGSPAGAPAWKGGLNKEITVKFDTEGVHVYKCVPHFVMGMIGAIQVGKPVNLSGVKSLTLKGKGKDRLAKILTQVK